MFNLQGLYRLADIGKQLGIDLWNYTSSQGPLLQKALDFLIPYVLEKETWPYSQISPISASCNGCIFVLSAAVSYPKMEGVYMKSFKYFIKDRPFFDVHNLPCLGR